MFVSDLLRYCFGLLDQPRKVFLICSVIVTLALVFDGSLFRLYGFYRQEDRLKAQIQAVQNETEEIGKQLQKARDPHFVERLARDRFDLVSEDELIFVFDE